MAGVHFNGFCTQGGFQGGKDRWEMKLDYDERPSSFSFHSIQLFKWKCPTKVKRVMQGRPFPLHLFSPGAKI